MAKKYSRRKAYSKANNRVVVALFMIIVIIALTIFALDALGYIDFPYEKFFGETKAPDNEVVVSGDLQIHFIELGNKYTGDCTYIKAGDTDILIDAGSRSNSIPTITGYVDKYCTDGILEYVIVTHADQDHIAGFAGSNEYGNLFSIYECKTIIDFAMTNKDGKATHEKYEANRNAEIELGAVHYTASDCIQTGNNVFTLSEGIELEILDSYYYYNKSSDENNYSVCCIINQGSNSFLFTGDLEEEGEEKLVEMNELPKVKLFKGGHHGSPTSSNECLLSVIQPEIVCVCCCAGSDEYTANIENQFPSQAFIDRVSKYTDKVYVTTVMIDNETSEFGSLNGNIVVSSSPDGVSVSCSGSELVLKESEWFKRWRTCPIYWQE